MLTWLSCRSISTLQPNRVNNSAIYSTSAIAGRFVITDFPGASKVDAINLSAEFFAPLTRTVPSNLAPPTTLKRSIIPHCNCLR